LGQDMVAILMGVLVLLFVLDASYGVSTASVINGAANALNPVHFLNATISSAGHGFWGVLAAVAAIALVAYAGGFAVSSIGLENTLMAGAFLLFLLLVV